jgi:hypothetical protein
MKKLALILIAFVVPGAATAATTTLHLTEKQTFAQYVDKGVKGESPGDIRTFGGNVFLRGTKVGHDRVRCVVAATCDAHVWIGGASLISKGFAATGPSFTAKITGGTGKYAGARGTVTVVGGPVARYTVRLTG